MKKNVMMRIASILLIAVLITTSAISGTYAKYVTTGSGDDTARVAKWGVTVTNSGDLFLQAYAKTDNTYAVSDNTVESSDTWKVIAPGTYCSNTDVVLEGVPEVAVKVTYEITELTVSGDWSDQNNDPYFPVIFTVGTQDFYIGQAGITSVAELVDAVKAAAAAYSVSYAPNSNLANKASEALEISWRWEFDGEKDGATLKGYQYDTRDTALGNKAADAAPGSELAIKLAVKTTVTQVD